MLNKKKIGTAMIAAMISVGLVGLPITSTLAHGNRTVKCYGVTKQGKWMSPKKWTYMTKKQCVKAKAKMKKRRMVVKKKIQEKAQPAPETQTQPQPAQQPSSGY